MAATSSSADSSADRSETPAEVVEPRAAALRFVILHHTGFGREHWDCFFEESHALAAWKVYHDPTVPAKEHPALFRAPDHRKHYLDHEGPVSAGRGAVSRLDAGTYVLKEKNSQRWRGELNGRVLCGPFELQHENHDCWRLRLQLPAPGECP